MRTVAQIKEKIEEMKQDTIDAGKVSSIEQLTFVQGYVEALKWVLK